eukprot:1931704-Prorocentrum_lima.AAC.1
MHQSLSWRYDPRGSGQEQFTLLILEALAELHGIQTNTDSPPTGTATSFSKRQSALSHSANTPAESKSSSTSSKCQRSETLERALTSLTERNSGSAFAT